MTPEQKNLVQTSFEKVKPIAEIAAALFYGFLFKLDPRLEPLFKGDLEDQGRKLMHMIGLAVKGLDHPDELLPLLHELGERHAGYGVEERDYETVRAALLSTLKRSLGDEFTPAVKEAWIAVYELLADTMKAGAREALIVTAVPMNNEATTCTGGDRNGWREYFPAEARKTLKRRETEMKSEDNYETLTGRFATTMSTIVMLIGVLFFATSAASAKTITVTGTGDTIAIDGLVTLREAICAANTNAICGDAPAGDPGADVIHFAIAGGGVKTIHLNGNLPAITEPLTIDGGGTPNSLTVGDNAVLAIVLDGSGAGASAVGLEIKAVSCVIRGLVINHFGDSGIKISGPNGKTATIEGNFIGTNETGAVGFNYGIRGIYVAASSGNTIGGSTPAKRNLISGNGSCLLCVGFGGVVVDALAGSATFNVIQGNYIGTDASGMIAIGNDSHGVDMNNAAANIIGGAATGAGNVISGNNGYGVHFENGANNFVQGNLIGTNAAGTVALPNAKTGVFIYNASGAQIGGVNAGERNVISGNTETGLYLYSGSGYIVQGNYVGTDVTGANPVGNAQEGILIYSSSTNQVGGTASGAGNVIAFNQGAGVAVVDGLPTSGDTISGNSIYGNAQLGIDLGGDGVTPNDLNDADTGPNNLQNYPVISSATSNGGVTTIKGTIQSESFRTDTLEFFASTTADPSGYGEGQTLIGSVILITDVDGKRSFSLTVPLDTQGKFITATASSDGNTSEFSQAIQVTGPTPNMSINDVSVSEGDIGFTKQMTFAVSLSAVSAQSVSVNYATADGTATSPEDYTTKSGLLTIPAGSTTGQIVVTIVGDDKFEPNEAFSVNLSNPTGALITKAQGVGTIQNDDLQPTITISNLDQSEGDSGTTSFDFSVGLSNRSYQPITVNYATAGGTATSGVDFQPASGTITFNPGDNTKTISVDVIGDTTPEPNETFFVNLSNPTNATIAKHQGVATIFNDDYPGLSISDASKAEGDNGTTIFTFNVTLSVPFAQQATVDYATVDGTAMAGSDYQAASGTLTFAPGETSRPINVMVNGDTTNEPDETFFVNLSNPGNATISKAQGTGTIINDDAPGGPTVQFSQANYSVQEDLGALTITVTRSDVSGTASVDYATSDGSATQKSDYEIAVGTLSFAAGEASKTVTILINEDSYIEGNEGFNVVLSNASGAALGQQSTTAITIIDDVPESATNPIDDAQSFVYTHYHDFLNREPDQAGLQFWTNQITSCGNDAQCVEVKRINVSASFFLSIEFQQTGFLLHLLQKESFASMPKYNSFMRDLQEVGRGVIVNAPGWEQKLKDNQQQFAEKWVNRAAFKAKYDGMSNADYVNELYSNAGILPTQAEKETLVAKLDAASETRAATLLEVAANSAFKQQEQNRAFVLMQYFGYLRRDPDAAPDSDLSGYNFWLLKLNNFNGNYIDAEMVKAFLTSFEYRGRFAQ